MADSRTLHKYLIHTKPMKVTGTKTKSVASLSIVLSLFAMSSSALADSLPSPSPSPSATSTRSPLEQYKVDRDNYLLALKARDIAIRTINQNFKYAIDRSAMEYRLAMQLAKNPDQKFQANNSRKSAITLAISVRDAAIALLGPEPTPPVEPLKLVKPKSAKEKKR